MFARACVLLLAISVTACSAARYGPLDSVLALTQTGFFNGLPSWMSSAFKVPQAVDALQFEAWKTEHGKAYGSEDEHKDRFQNYQENVRRIEEHNRVHKDVKLVVNKFADLTNEEFKKTYTPKTFDLSRERKPEFRHASVGEVPAAVDWRTQGAVTLVKDQGQCGSCWSFSTTGSTEGIHAIKTGKLLQLSEQELVDCDTSMDHGCNGGLMDYAFNFIVANGGLDTEEDYPYTGAQQTCKLKKEKRDVAEITGFEDVPTGDEAAMQQAVSQQPVSVAIEADQFAFQFYSTGVINTPLCGTQLDHGVLVVGYGTDNTTGVDVDYWIVKNSWGPTWGEEGYLRIARHSSPLDVKGPGTCGIALSASYPVLDDVKSA